MFQFSEAVEEFKSSVNKKKPRTTTSSCRFALGSVVCYRLDPPRVLAKLNLRKMNIILENWLTFGLTVIIVSATMTSKSTNSNSTANWDVVMPRLVSITHTILWSSRRKNQDAKHKRETINTSSLKYRFTKKIKVKYSSLVIDLQSQSSTLTPEWVDLRCIKMTVPMRRKKKF